MIYNSDLKAQTSLFHLMVLCSSLYSICFLYMFIQCLLCAKDCYGNRGWRYVSEKKQEKIPDLT